MSTSIQYETPENVQLEYRPAGVGTRFVAWFLDSIILSLLVFLTFLALTVIGAATDLVVRDIIDRIEDSTRDANPELVVVYFVGIAMLVWGLSSFLYYGLSELLFRGQTLGKRASKIRVVKLNGFSLDAVSIFVRNLFRVADQLPPLWIVPVLSPRHQRFGDMVAGTIVISEKTESLAEIREQLSSRNAAEARYRFENAKLQKLVPSDFEAIERILERWSTLPREQQQLLLDRMMGQLCKKLGTEEPPVEDRVTFLEDLLAAEFRRQDRQLR